MRWLAVEKQGRSAGVCNVRWLAMAKQGRSVIKQGLSAGVYGDKTGEISRSVQ